MASTMQKNVLVKRQQGAVLLVGLLILLLATMISVSALNNSNLQEKMASNAQNLNRAYQSAQGAIDHQVAAIQAGTTSMLSDAIVQAQSGSPTWPTTTFTLTGDSSVTTSLTIKYRGTTIATGGSLPSGEDTTQLPTTIFELDSTATMNSTNAASHLVQGIQFN